MTLASNAFLGLENRFNVVVDGVNLGAWNSCAGLAVDFHLDSVKEGGEYGFVHWLPGRAEYPKVVLKRAMSASDSGQVQQWLASKVDNFTGGTAQITLLDSRQQTVHTWSLRNVYPSAWKGPDMNADASKVAMETLELVHEGFL